MKTTSFEYPGDPPARCVEMSRKEFKQRYQNRSIKVLDGLGPMANVVEEFQVEDDDILCDACNEQVDNVLWVTQNRAYCQTCHDTYLQPYLKATYTEISKEEVEAVLSPLGFKPLKLKGTDELVYGKRVDHYGIGLTVRIYTSLSPWGTSRDVGEDAIRVNLWLRETLQEGGAIRKIASTKRVNRVPGWANRLKGRIETCLNTIGPRCPGCGYPMIRRKGGKGPFFGCSRYPHCSRTANYFKSEKV